MGWDWLYLKDSLRYTLASLILVTFVQTIFDSIRFLTFFLILLVSWFYPVLQMCQVYRYVLILVNSIYIHTIVLLLAVSQVLYGFVCFSTRSFRVVST